MQGKKGELRSGITTGTCAAGAAKAAMLALRGEKPRQVKVRSPQGQEIPVPVAGCTVRDGAGEAWVIKDAGDDPDITNGAEIRVQVCLNSSGKIEVAAGVGVGRVTKPGLKVPPGQPAINPGPQTMIRQAIEELLPEGQGAVVTVSVPDGQRLAKHTLNSFLGVEGGLSIIGTTGIIHPMSEEAFKDSLGLQLSVLAAQGHKACIFVPGKMGESQAIAYGLPAKVMVQTSNFVGYMLEQAVYYELKQILLMGHMGKLIKVAAGSFHTHNRVADGRMETMAAYAALLGGNPDAVKKILACATTEEAATIVAEQGLQGIYPLLAASASARSQRYVFGELQVGTVLTSLRGEILGMDENAKQMGANWEWTGK